MKEQFYCISNICRIQDESDKEFAEVGYNPKFLYIRFVITDNKPNGNGVRIPEQEFANIKRTALYAPIKVDFRDGEPWGHDNALPVGVIISTKVEDDKVIGLGAIWAEEFPEVAKYVSEKVKSGEMVYLSWELYGIRKESQEFPGVYDMRDVTLTAVAIVKNPAYGNRTPIDRVSSEKAEQEMNEEKLWEEYWAEYEEFYEDAAKWSREYINNLPDDAFLYIEPGGKKDKEGKTVPRYLRHLPYKNHRGEIDLPHLRNAIARLAQGKTGTKGGRKWLTESLRKRLLAKARRILQEALKKKKSEEGEMPEELLNETMPIEEALNKIQELTAENESLKAQLQEVTEELEKLREFKAQVEAEVERQRRLQEIKQKFAEAGLSKDDKYFEENAEKLLSMEDDALDFLIKELVAFKEASQKQDKEESEQEVPNFVGAGAELASRLREMLKELN